MPATSSRQRASDRPIKGADSSARNRLRVKIAAVARAERCDWLEGVRGLSPASVDLVYVDPPFNTGQDKIASGGRFSDRWKDPESHLRWLRERIAATIPAIKPSGSMLLHVDWRTCHLVRLMLDELLGADRFVNHLIWAYGLGGSSARRFARKHDDILFYAIDPERYWFQAPQVPATSRRMNGRMKKATDVLSIPSINNMARERAGWPTQKPQPLLELLIGACCPPGGMVLDPCCGSGTALVAARRLGRNAIGFDTSGRAIGISLERIKRESESLLAARTTNDSAHSRGGPV